MMVQLRINHNCTGIDEGPGHGRADVNPEQRQTVKLQQEPQIQKINLD